VNTQQEFKKLSLVASKTDNSVIITDAAGLTEWVNEGFTRITGYTLSEMAGKKPGAILQGPETDKATVAEISENLRLGLHFSTQLINYRKSGDMFWISMDVTPIQNEAGAVTQFIAIQKDITYLKEAEASLLSLTQDLYLQNKNLQEFTYIVSHNLRAPVANALGLANLLYKTDSNSDIFKNSLGYLKTSVLKMDTVLKDVNMILAVKDKQDVLEMEQVRLYDVFREAYNYLKEPTLLCGGNVTIDLPEDLTVNANKAYLFSIFYNLLSNSIKYRSGERQLEIKVGYCTQGPDGNLLISFSDNGTGFDAEKAGNDIFKLYKRFHKDKRGRGMGLFLVKAHIEAMGWKIEVNSRLGEGTTFLIYTNY
jgi:PAS domain S-box-containing protein